MATPCCVHQCTDVLHVPLQIDLSGQHVEITEKLTLTNTGREHLKSFVYCLPEQHVQRLSYLAVRAGPSASTDLPSSAFCSSMHAG